MVYVYPATPCNKLAPTISQLAPIDRKQIFPEKNWEFEYKSYRFFLNLDFNLLPW